MFQSENEAGSDDSGSGVELSEAAMAGKHTVCTSSHTT